jgi:hypothetical protein
MSKVDKELDAWLAWRERERNKHRVMTWSEYRAWCVIGDAISSPRENVSFPGGLTIEFGSGVMGRTIDGPSDKNHSRNRSR